jgi:YHS domain-containing protein
MVIVKHPVFILVALTLMCFSTFAAKPLVFSTREGAIEGYDPVAYFTKGMPVRGSDKYSLEWNGATFKFSSLAHFELFKAAPGKYAPQYGGYCAYAVSEGATASTVPEAWTIVDDKLYLNFSTGVRNRWSKDIPGRVARADENWPDVLN